MDELIVAHINAHMGGGVAAVGEEYQIAGLQLAAADIGAVLQLGGGAVGQGDAQLVIHIHGKAGAVKAAGGGAAVDIGYAQILIGDADGGAAGAAGGYRGCGVVRGGAAGILRRQRGTQRHILLGHIAVGAVIGYGIPTAALRQHGDSGTLGQGSQNRRGGVGVAAEPDVRGVDHAVAQRFAGACRGGQLRGGLCFGLRLCFCLSFRLRLGLSLRFRLGLRFLLQPRHGGNGGLHRVRGGRRQRGAQCRAGGQTGACCTDQIGGGGGQGDGCVQGNGIGYRHHRLLDPPVEDGEAGNGGYHHNGGQRRDQNAFHRLTAFRPAPAPARWCRHP